MTATTTATASTMPTMSLSLPVLVIADLLSFAARRRFVRLRGKAGFSVFEYSENYQERPERTARKGYYGKVYEQR